MLMWLRVLLLVAKLSFVLSTVVVITITEDDEQGKQIAAIEAKLDSHDEELNQLGNVSQAQNDTINFLSNLTQELQEKFEKHKDKFQNTNVIHQDQLDYLTEKIKEMLSHDVKFELQVKEHQANLNKTFQSTYKHQQEQIENLTKQNKELKEDIQKIHKVPLKNSDILGFDLLATKGWLGCPLRPCDLRKCPSASQQIGANKFKHCGGEQFQIFGNGDEYIRSGYKVRIRFVIAGSKWLSCYNGSCTVQNCPGSTTKGTNFKISCRNETFTIYGMARRYGDVIYNGDLVMLHINTNGNKYISIKGHREGDDASLDFCPGNVPPYYFSYFTCTRNVFQTYKIS